MENFIKNLSHKRKHKETPKHRTITYRILFTLALVAFVFQAMSGIVENNDQPINSNASTTRSETDQLKSQIALLQMEKAALQNELQRYVDTYGELPFEAEDGASTEENSEDDENADEASKAENGEKAEDDSKAEDATTKSKTN